MNNPLTSIALQHRLIRAMAWREMKYRHAGTIGGILWSFVQPAVTILVYWMVFSVGLKVQPVRDVPFIVVYVAAFLPWTLLVETLTNSSNSVCGNPHLVKKVAFPTELLPIVQLMASLVTHTVMLVLFLFLLAANGIYLTLSCVQFLYYILGLIVFTLGLSWLLAAVNVLYRDTGQVLSMVLQVWFWLTPIVWPIDMLPLWGQRLIRLNPMYYITEGYRSAFVLHKPLWNEPLESLYFWSVAIGMFNLGWWVFSRLKPDFADVL